MTAPALIRGGRWLLAVAVALAVLAVASAVWAVSAYSFASAAHHWATTIGTVVPTGGHPAAVRFADTAGHVHLMPLQAGDTDDLPVGSVIRLSYDVTAGGAVRSEFAVQPGARASALTVLALAGAAGSVIAAATWRARRLRRD